MGAAVRMVRAAAGPEYLTLPLILKLRAFRLGSGFRASIRYTRGFEFTFEGAVTTADA